MTNFTAALNVIDTEYHVTLCFADCAKAKKVRTTSDTGILTVTDVEYWEHCDLTVAIVNSDFCDARAKYWQDNGYSYSLGYKPHFTLGRGDCVSEYERMKGREFTVGDEYVRVF